MNSSQKIIKTAQKCIPSYPKQRNAHHHKYLYAVHHALLLNFVSSPQFKIKSISAAFHSNQPVIQQQPHSTAHQFYISIIFLYKNLFSNLHPVKYHLFDNCIHIHEKCHTTACNYYANAKLLQFTQTTNKTPHVLPLLSTWYPFH